MPEDLETPRRSIATRLDQLQCEDVPKGTVAVLVDRLERNLRAVFLFLKAGGFLAGLVEHGKGGAL